MAVGDMRRLMTLERNMRTGDGGGGATESWISVAQIWAAIEALSGDEGHAEHRVSGRVSHEITLRYRSDVEPEMRLTLDGRVFHLLAVFDKDGRRRWLTCLAEEQDL